MHEYPCVDRCSFQLWHSVFLKWERCNIFDGFGDVPTHPPKPIGKSTFGCLTNPKEKQLKKLAKGLLSKKITLREHQVKGRRPNFKSMYKFTRMLKQKAMIRNDIMIHFGHPKPTVNNQKPYSNYEWHALKDKHELNKMLFSILDSKLNDDLYLKNLRLNPLDKGPPIGFKWNLEKWIQNGTLEDNVVEAILLDIHYKYDRVENMVGLLDVINKESCASFLMDDTTMTIVIVYTTHNTKDISTISKGLGWESFLLGLLNVRAMFKVVVCICNHKSFKSLLTIVYKLTFVTKIQFEFGQYMARLIEVPSSSMTLLSVPILMFAYLFPCKIGTNVCVEILGNKKLLVLVECLDSSFQED